MVQEIYSPKIFIGREKEIALFKQMLDDQKGEKWIINLVGAGGVGKTLLMQQFTDIIKDRKKEGKNYLFTNEPIDLYWTAHQRELGILKSIADQIAPDEFKPFNDEIDKYTELLQRREELPVNTLPDQEKEAIEQFISSYQKLSTDRIILFFDTAELSSEAIIRFWKQSLPRFQDAISKNLVIIAGRKPVKVTPLEIVESVQISGLLPKEVDQYFKTEGYTFSEEVINKISKLSQGKPIYMALIIDWLETGKRIDNLLTVESIDQFEKSMVESILKLRYPEDQAILAMAHFYRRFNKEILTNVLNLTPEEAQKLIEALARFAFVKYRSSIDSDIGSCVLHDEMRDLINRHAWNALDPLFDYRPKWNKKIVYFYEEETKKSVSEQNPIEEQNLNLERLYYWLDLDLEAAFTFYHQLFQRAIDKYDNNFMEDLNQEISRKVEELSPQMKRQFDFHEGIIYHRRERYQEAIEKINILLNTADCEADLQIEATTRLIVLFTEGGDPQKAIDLGLTLEKELNTQIAKINPDHEKYKLSKSMLGRLCNNIGFAFRGQNRYKETIEYYKKALNHYIDIREDVYARIARTRNNLGFAYNRLGHNEEALSQCLEALQIRERLNNPYEIGLSYNVLGIIYTDMLRVEEAKKYFEKALDVFTRAGSKRGRALACVAYGRLLRQWGYYKETFVDEPHNPDRDEYLEAGQKLDEAIEICRLLSNRPILLEALNEKASLLRNRKMFLEAIQYFEESKDTAILIGDITREIDNLQDLAILFFEYGKQLESALQYSEEASQKAFQTSSFYLYAKAQMTLGRVSFEKKKFDMAFKAAANALIYILRPDPHELGHESPKKNLSYDKFIHYTTEFILKLPNLDLAKEKCDYLIYRWREAEVEGKKLEDAYPGFIEKMIALSQDYPLLKEVQE